MHFYECHIIIILHEEKERNIKMHSDLCPTFKNVLI
jgi:hypothetical protein